MSLLLDTHVLIWWFDDSRRIAQCEGLTLVTVDPQVMAYDVPTLDASR